MNVAVWHKQIRYATMNVTIQCKQIRHCWQWDVAPAEEHHSTPELFQSSNILEYTGNIYV